MGTHLDRIVRYDSGVSDEKIVDLYEERCKREFADVNLVKIINQYLYSSVEEAVFTAP